MKLLTAVSFISTIILMLLKAIVDKCFKAYYPEASLLFTPILDTLYDLSLTLFAVFLGWSISKAYDEQRKFKLAAKSLTKPINTILLYKRDLHYGETLNNKNARNHLSESIIDLFFYGHQISKIPAKKGALKDFANIAKRVEESVKPHISYAVARNFPEDVTYDSLAPLAQDLLAFKDEIEQVTPRWLDFFRQELNFTEDKTEIQVPLQKK